MEISAITENQAGNLTPATLHEVCQSQSSLPLSSICEKLVNMLNERRTDKVQKAVEARSGARGDVDSLVEHVLFVEKHTGFRVGGKR